MKLFWLQSRGDRQVMWARYDDGITVAGFRFLITVEAVDGVTPPRCCAAARALAQRSPEVVAALEKVAADARRLEAAQATPGFEPSAQARDGSEETAGPSGAAADRGFEPSAQAHVDLPTKGQPRGKGHGKGKHPGRRKGEGGGKGGQEFAPARHSGRGPGRSPGHEWRPMRDQS